MASKGNNSSVPKLSFLEVSHNDHEIVSQCQALRVKVFVEEQGIPSEIELDGHDHFPYTQHLMVTTQPTSSLDSVIIGTGRIVFPSIESSNMTFTAILGRIAVHQDWRNYGIGTKVVQELEQLARRQQKHVVHRLRLTPHHYLEQFYSRLGFTRIKGDEDKFFVHNGCHLITMEKRLIESPEDVLVTTNLWMPTATSRRKKERKICLFGTSANPPTGTGGHLGIVQALLAMKSLQDESQDVAFAFDEIYVLPVYQHTFASKRQLLASYEHRVSMCKLAFAGLDRVVISRAEERSFQRMSQGISDPEEQSALQVGTADLLEMLLEESRRDESDMPTSEFSFCLGADTFLDLTNWKWKRSKDVLRLLEGRLIVVHRKGVAQEEELQERVKQINREEGGQVKVLDVPLLENVSSSLARASMDRETLNQLLPTKVVDYIVAEKLYAFAS